jgi:hypothetical protein
MVSGQLHASEKEPPVSNGYEARWAVVKIKIMALSGFDPRPFSPQAVTILTELSRRNESNMEYAYCLYRSSNFLRYVQRLDEIGHAVWSQFHSGGRGTVKGIPKCYSHRYQFGSSHTSARLCELITALEAPRDCMLTACVRVCSHTNLPASSPVPP